MREAALVVLCACRIGFDAVPSDAARDDTGAIATTTITFGERPTSQRTGVTIDTRLDQGKPDTNYGASEDLSIAAFAANAEHTLLRFDVSSLAPGTPIAGARLRVTRLDYGDETLGPVQLRLLAESWTEGTNTGMPGTGATWNMRDDAVAWTTAGGTTTQTLITVTPTAADVVIEIPPAVVQSWVDAPATNAGLLLTSGTPSVHLHFHASDSVLMQRAGRPELAVDVPQ